MNTKSERNYYHQQVELLLKILPFVAKEDCFALKGGTAINFFVRDMPRLSVDIDLTYVPLEPRDSSLMHIEEALLRIKRSLKDAFPKIEVREKRTQKDSRLNKLFASQNDVLVKIEPNDVLRGSVFPTEMRNVTDKIEEIFELSVSDVPILSMADLYGGKICAALARQHPRDLFDVKLLLENEGITDAIRQAFLVYLASSPRPMHELLNPNPTLQDMRSTYEDSFVGMTRLPIIYEELVEVRYSLIRTLLSVFTNDERQFLISVKEGLPNWNKLPLKGIEKLPSLNWKIFNVNNMEQTKRISSLEKLKKVLDF